MDADWVERLEIGSLRHPVAERVALLERLVVAHESYYEIMASWDAEVERRIAEYDAGLVETIPAEEVLAKLRARVAAAPRWRLPRIPESIHAIEDQALHLPHDEFYLLLTKLEAGLPGDIDSAWRADIQRRIAAVPAEVERRYRESNGGWEDDDDLLAS